MILLTWSTAEAARPVRPSFDCLDGERATVTSERSRAQSIGGAEVPSSPAGGFRGVEVREARDGTCRVTTSGTFDTTGMPGPVADLMTAVSAYPTTTILGPDAVVRGIDGLGPLSAAMSSHLEGLGADLPPPLRAALEGMVAGLVSEEAIVAQESVVWAERAGFWHGRAVKPGRTYTVPGTPEVDPHTYAVAPTPCPTGAGTCARLSLEWTIDPGRLAAELQGIMAPLASALGPQVDLASAVSGASKVTAHELVVDPATLRPYAHREVETVTLQITLPGQPAERVVRTTTQSTTWTWDPR